MPAHKDADTGASEATMHDDRAYCLALLGWYLQERCLENIRNKKRDNGNMQEILSKLSVSAGKHIDKIFG